MIKKLSLRLARLTKLLILQPWNSLVCFLCSQVWHELLRNH